MTLALQGSVETDDDFFLNALEGMERCEAGWRLRHKVWSWIDQKPTWVSAAEWDSDLGDGFPPNPTEPCRRWPHRRENSERLISGIHAWVWTPPKKNTQLYCNSSALHPDWSHLDPLPGCAR